MKPSIQKAYAEMAELEHGAIAGPDAKRMVGHYWLRNPALAIDNTLSQLRGLLGQAITVVVSKSGGTKETGKGMVEAEARYKAAGLNFGPHAVAITSEDSALDKLAVQQGWLARFPMWDWVGGRTSETSAVGLLPSALQGLDVDGLLEGGLSNSFVIFVEVLRDRMGSPLMVEPNVTSGDFLEGFPLGIKQALFEHNRDSITLTVNSVTGFSIGMLIVLFERAVGFYVRV